MDDRLKTLNTWLSFTGFVMAVATLYWAQVVLVPVATAALITFILAPLVTRLHRRIGRVPAVCLVVALVFGSLTAATWILSRQLTELVAELPAYRTNIRQKAADVRRAARGGSVDEVQKTIADIQHELQEDENARGTTAEPVVVTSEQQAFRDAVRGFAEKNLREGALARAHSPEHPWDVSRLMSKQGLMGITIPEADGGQGGTLMDAIIAIETVAQVCPRIGIGNRRGKPLQAGALPQVLGERVEQS